MFNRQNVTNVVIYKGRVCFINLSSLEQVVKANC